MSQSVYQFIDLQRVDPPEKLLKIRRIGFVKIYEPFSEDQAKMQTDRHLSYGGPYCEWKCSMHNYIPNWLRLANEGRIFEAAELSHQADTLLKVYGHVYLQGHLCEDFCTLNDEFDAVTTGNIEHCIDDRTFEVGWRPDISGVKQTGKKMAIIGANPAGLACANVLTRNGMKAIVFDRRPEIGRLLTFGIPVFRLEKEVMTHCHEVFAGMDIGFKSNTGVDRDIQLDDLLSDYDTVFLGVETYQPVRDELESEGADGVYAALPLLITNTKQLMGFGETSNESFASMEDKRMVVLGGDGTAIDCVRTSVRRGARYVTCAYRRDEENMPSLRREMKNAREKGVEFKFSIQPLGIEMNGNGKVSGVKTARTEMGEPDAKGRRHTKIVVGSEHIAPAGAVIMAFDLRPHSVGWLTKHSVELGLQGRIVAPKGSDNAFQTSNPKIFAGGNIARGFDLVVTAVAGGRKAADGIMNWLEV